MTARVSVLLKLRASLTFFRACFLPDRAKDLSAPRQNPQVIKSERARKLTNMRDIIRHSSPRPNTGCDVRTDILYRSEQNKSHQLKHVYRYTKFQIKAIEHP